MRNKVNECELCERMDVVTTVHHLIPKEEGGNKGPVADLCIPCHKNIDALYTNKELAIRLSSIKELKEDERIRKFVKWVRRQPSSAMVRTRKSKYKAKKILGE